MTYDGTYGSGAEYSVYYGNDGMYSTCGSSSQTSVGSASDIGCNGDYADFGKKEINSNTCQTQPVDATNNGYDNTYTIAGNRIPQNAVTQMYRKSVYNPMSMQYGANTYDQTLIGDSNCTSSMPIENTNSQNGLSPYGEYMYAPFYNGSQQTAEQMQQAVFNSQLQNNLPQYMTGLDPSQMGYNYDPQLMNMLIMQANSYQNMQQNPMQSPSTPCGRISGNNVVLNPSPGMLSQNSMGMYQNPTHMYDPNTQMYSQQLLAQQLYGGGPQHSMMNFNNFPMNQRQMLDPGSNSLKNSHMGNNGPCSLRKAIKKELPIPPGKEKDARSGKIKRGLCC